MKNILKFFEGFGVDKNTAATIFTTIFIFSFGLFITWIGGQYKIRRLRKEYRKNLIYILKDFSASCLRNSNVVTKSLKNVGFVKGSEFNITYIPIGTLDYLSKLDLTDLFKNFKNPFFNRPFFTRKLPLINRPLCPKRNHLKAISKLISILYQIKVVNDQLPVNYKYFYDHYRVNEKKFYDNVDELRKFNDELATRYNGKPNPPEIYSYMKGYFDIFIKWVDDGGSTIIENEQNEIVRKVLEHNKKFLSHEFAFRTNNLALGASHAFDNIFKVDGLLVDLFETFARAHDRASKMIPLIIEILE